MYEFPAAEPVTEDVPAEEHDAIAAAIAEYMAIGQSKPLETVTVGSACLGQFTDDDLWYRATIDEMDESGVTVTFVDYGNSETLVYDRLHVLPESLANLAPAMLPTNVAETPGEVAETLGE